MPEARILVLATPDPVDCGAPAAEKCDFTPVLRPETLMTRLFSIAMLIARRLDQIFTAHEQLNPIKY